MHDIDKVTFEHLNQFIDGFDLDDLKELRKSIGDVLTTKKT